MCRPPPAGPAADASDAAMGNAEKKPEQRGRINPNTVVASLVALDRAVGKGIHSAASRSRLAQLAATVASLAVDEAVWFAGPLIAALFCFLVEIAGTPLTPFPLARALHFRRLAVELFTDAVLVTAFGALLKLITRRKRPSYAAQMEFHITNGDVFSFPSGHSLFGS